MRRSETSMTKEKKSEIELSQKRELYDTNSQNRSTMYNSENKYNGQPENLNSVISRLENEINEREKIQASLMASEERYRIISEVSTDFSFLVNVDENGIRKLDWISPGFEKEMGFAFEELIHGTNWKKHIHLEDHQLRQNITANINKGKVGQYEIRTFKGDGEICWLGVIFYPVYDKTLDRTTKYYGSIRDITENKKIELELQQINSELELRVQERTTQIENAVKNLQNEISQRIAIEEKLIASEKRYRKLIELSPEAIFVHRNGKILFANSATLKLFGVKSVADFHGKNILDFIHEDSKKIAAKQYESVMNDLETESIIEVKGMYPNGNLIFTEISSTLVEYNGEKAVQVVARDITERKESEIALWESQERYRLTVEYAPFAIVIHQNGKIVYANPETLKLMGATAASEIVGKDVLSFVHLDFRNTSAQRLKNSYETGKPTPPFQERLICLDGKLIDVEVLSVPFMLGQSLAFETIINDISQMKAANEQLRKLSRAVEQSSAAIVITDKDGHIEYTNPKFTEMTGFTKDEVLGQNPRILKSGRQTEEAYAVLWGAILSGNEWKGEIINKRKSGDLYWEFSSISPIKNSNGEITHFLAVKEDITNRKQIEAELIKSKEEAEEASKIKSSLLANMSHEFRTPLNGILGFTQLLKEEVFHDEQKMMVDKIYRSGKRLMNTLNSILSLTEMENGEYVISNSEIDMTYFCHQLKALYETQAKEKSLDFDLTFSEEKLLVKTDENLLTKIVSHIIDNAIKYTTQGSIRINLRKAKRFNGNEVAIVDIVDSGIGIRKDEQKIIFREFRQLSEGFRRDFEGLGLGLTLASKMARLINAEIKVHSEFGKGSTFSVMLPLDHAELNIAAIDPFNTNKTLPVASSLSIDEKELNILLIEDNPLNIEVVERFLSSVAKVTYARDGESAVKTASEQIFDILLIDINLGHGMNGIEVLEKIRQFDQYKNTPAVALTGYASAANKRDFLLKGFTNYLPKPFDKRVLLNLIKQIR